MTLYGTLDALMCQACSMTLRRPTRIWYSRLRPSSISCFNQLVKEFELNFLASTRPKPTVTSLLARRTTDPWPSLLYVSQAKSEEYPTYPSLAQLRARTAPSRYLEPTSAADPPWTESELETLSVNDERSRSPTPSVAPYATIRHLGHQLRLVPSVL
ncbi:hypothetical protein B296_00045411 [Ensete ventricosum]|uniref:Uncharacterized protein n=1 Tax=Ensete ventricosum TaxID=4639 RepID=A0A426Z7H5_ENSVE|nr:hypothetical protein B296_00045411 [Ensete ventricosum]